MLCGHLNTSLVSSDEETMYCLECDREAQAEAHAKYDAECAEARGETQPSKAVEKAQAEGSADANEDTQSKLLSPFN